MTCRDGALSTEKSGSGAILSVEDDGAAEGKRRRERKEVRDGWRC